METSIQFLRGAPRATAAAGREAVRDPDDLQTCREVLVDHPTVRDAPSPSLARALVEQARFVRYRAGYALMSAGERGDRIALVLGGRCRVFDPAAETGRTVAFVGQHDVLGEMSLLSAAPRRHTVVAVRDTLVAEIAFEAFEALDELDAVLLRAWLAEIAARRALGIGGERPVGTALVVLPLSDAEGEPFARALAGAFEAIGESCAVVRHTDFDDLPTPMALERIAQQHTHVVYVAERGETLWNGLAIRQADRVLRVADAGDDPKTRGFDLEAQAAAAPSVLVLMQPSDARAARGTIHWLEPRPGVSHLHVRRANAADLARVARVVTRRARGVVYCGASSQGLGYAGMMRAFEQMGYAPDIIAGNSSGGIPAAIFARGGTGHDTAEAGARVLDACRPGLGNITLPLVSFLTGRRLTRCLREIFGDSRLEDQLLPCVITAVDISSQRRVDISRGPIWHAVRATMSLPIIYPPVIDGEAVLVDGGALENYPIDQIEPVCRRGQVLVCDLSQAIEPMQAVEQYGAGLSGWRVLLDRLWPFGRKVRYPTVGEVVFRTATLASAVHADIIKARARPNWVFLRPKSPSAGLFALTGDAQSALMASVEADTLARRDEIMGPGEET